MSFNIAAFLVYLMLLMNKASSVLVKVQIEMVINVLLYLI